MPKTAFENYLVHISHFNKDLLDAARSHVASAELGYLSNLDRVFNNFPLHYAIDGKEFSALPSKKMQEWIAGFEAILAKKGFQLVETKGELEVRLDSQSKDKMQHLVLDIIKQSCDDCLDEKGRLRSGLVDTLGLQQLMIESKYNPDACHNIGSHILYSYCSQLVNANFSMLLDENDALDKLQIAWLNTYYGHLLTDHLKKEMLDHLVENTAYTPRNFAQFLRSVPAGHLTRLVTLDIASNEAKITDVDHLQQKLEVERAKFWCEVMTDLQKSKEILHLEAIWHGLPQAVRSSWDALSDTLTFSGDFKLDQSEHKNEEQQYDLNDWFRARDNSYILDHLVRALGQSKSVAALKAELQNTKFDIKLVEQPTFKLFKILYEKSKQPDVLLRILEKYMPELALQIKPSENSAIAELIKKKEWLPLIPFLINSENTNLLTHKDIKVLQKYRKDITQALIQFVSAYESPEEQRDTIAKVINTQNAAGIILHTTAYPFKWKTAGSIKILTEFQKKLEESDFPSAKPER